MTKQTREQERKVYVTIRSGKKKETHETWRFYSTVTTLGWFGATRQEANEAAKWAQKAKPGDRRELWPDITMEVTEE